MNYKSLRAQHLNWTQSEVWLCSVKGFQCFLVFFLLFWALTMLSPLPFSQWAYISQYSSPLISDNGILWQWHSCSCEWTCSLYLCYQGSVAPLQTELVMEERGQGFFGSVHEKYIVGLSRGDPFLRLFLLALLSCTTILFLIVREEN